MFVREGTVYVTSSEAIIILGVEADHLYEFDEIDSIPRSGEDGQHLFSGADVLDCRLKLADEEADLSFRPEQWTEPDLDSPTTRELVNKLRRHEEIHPDQLGGRYEELIREGQVDRYLIEPEGVDLPEEEVRERRRYVEDGCFGWADEHCEECREHCAVFAQCLEQREEIFESLAAELVGEEESERRVNELRETAAQVDAVREETEGKFDKIEETDTSGDDNANLDDLSDRMSKGSFSSSKV